MSDIDVYKVVKKLTGPIDPIGEAHIDDKRLENLKVVIDLVDRLLVNIHRVSYKNRNRHEYSIKMAGELATNFLNELGIEE